MVLKNLENALPDDQIEKYIGVFNQLEGPTYSVLGRTLDIAALLNKNGLRDDYVLFGGYGVLSHMMDSAGEEIAVSWRGSDDIDMAATNKAVNIMKSNYDVFSDKQSPNLLEKRTVKLHEDNGKDCKIDLYTGPFNEKFWPVEIHNHFGIPVRVAGAVPLIRGKLKAPREEDVHSIDIVRLLSVLEREDYCPSDIARDFSADQKMDLLDRMRAGYKLIGAGLLSQDLLPSQKFKKDLESELHKGRPI